MHCPLTEREKTLRSPGQLQNGNANINVTNVIHFSLCGRNKYAVYEKDLCSQWELHTQYRQRPYISKVFGTDHR